MLYLQVWIVIYLVPFLAVIIYHLNCWNFGVLSFENTRVWVSSYECGFMSASMVENVFSYTYFVLMVFFVIFDLEISLLINIPYQNVLYLNFFFYTFFLILLSLSYFLEIEKGYVSWNY